MITFCALCVSVVSDYILEKSDRGNRLKSVMLTGATGFIGSHIAERLIREKIATHLFVRRKTGFMNYLEEKGAMIYVGQPEDLEVLKKSLEDVDTVIHCAGAVKALKKEDYFRANVEFTGNILGLLYKEQRIVFISSQAAAGPSNDHPPLNEEAEPKPLTHYGMSKLLAENMVREWGEENCNSFIILRPSVVYGPRERALYRAFKAINKGLFFTLGGGHIKISIIHVEDLVRAIIMSAEQCFTGETFFVSYDEAYSWEEIGDCIGRALDKSHLLKLKIPLLLAYPVVHLMDMAARLTKKPTLLSSQKLIEVRQTAWLCSNRKIKEKLRWKPEISLENGIKQTADWYLKEGWI